MYIVLKNFTDLEDNNHKYTMGEEYPRKGYEPTEERVKALTSGNNKAGIKLLKEVKAPKKAEPKEAEPKEEKPVEAKPKKKASTKKKSGGKKASK